MSKLMIAVYMALLICPFIAIILTEPAVYIQYRRNNIINVVRCAQLYLLFTFTLCAYFLTMLPFPSIESVSRMTNTPYQLIPFYWVYDFITNAGVKITDWRTVFPALKSMIIWGVFLNILMLVPSGFLTRRLFKIGTPQMCLFGFIISLVFELTQLSGLFFIYPRPYRVFDVDDLIQNTCGFVLGGLIAIFIEGNKRFRRELTVRQGGEVSFRRRIKCGFIDQSIVFLLTGVIIYLLNKNDEYFGSHPFKSFPIYFLIIIFLNEVLAFITYISNGKSLGMLIIGLRVRDVKGNRISLSQCVARYFTQAICINLPLLIGWFITLSQDRHIIISVICTFLSAVLVFLYVCYILSMALYIITHGEKLIYDKLSNTYLGLDENIPVRKRQRVLYRSRLTEDSINFAIGEMHNILTYCGIDEEEKKKILCVIQAALIQWMEDGLFGHNYTVQIDNRRSGKVMLVCVHGKRVELSRDNDSLMEMVASMRISYDAYYTGGINVFAVEI